VHNRGEIEKFGGHEIEPDNWGKEFDYFISTELADKSDINYADKIITVLFNERVAVGRTEDDTELTEVFRAWGSKEIARLVTEGSLIFSEIDVEGVSQLERLTRQKRMSGHDNYFIMGERGVGASDDDHIFASYLCFIYALRGKVQQTSNMATLARPSGNTTAR
jgi:hypothetical protein